MQNYYLQIFIIVLLVSIGFTIYKFKPLRQEKLRQEKQQEEYTDGPVPLTPEEFAELQKMLKEMKEQLHETKPKE